MATLTVDTAWRVSRVEFQTMHNQPHTINGYGEIVVKESGKDTQLGIMPGAVVTRDIDSVLDEAVEVDGQAISFATVSEALKIFLVRWQLEDMEKPETAAFIRPQAAELTPMPEPLKMPEVPVPFKG